MGGIYLDRDAFLHRRVDHYRWRHDAVLGLEPSNFERDRVANFGCLMARPNSTFFQLFWDGAGRAAYANTSYLRTWGGWAHDSCRKSYALAMKRPDLVHLEARDVRVLVLDVVAAGEGRGEGEPPVRRAVPLRAVQQQRLDGARGQIVGREAGERVDGRLQRRC